MSELAGQVSLSEERKRKVKAMFFMDIICIKSPFGQVCGSPSKLHTVLLFGYNSGTDTLILYGDFGTD
jgi:hypothetical protein